MCVVFKKRALARAHLVSLAAAFSAFTIQGVELVIASRCQCGKKTTNEYFIWLLFLTSISLQGKCVYLNRALRIKPLLSPMRVQERATVLKGSAVGLVWGRVPAGRSSGAAAASGRSLGRAARSWAPWSLALLGAPEPCAPGAVGEPGQKDFLFCKLKKDVNVQLQHNCISPALSLTGLAHGLCFSRVVLGSKTVLLRRFFWSNITPEQIL